MWKEIDEMKSSMMAILAGSDTTSTTLSNVLYLVLRHPRVYEKLQEEIDKYYPTGDNALDCVHHPEMSYLHVVHAADSP